MFYRINSPQVSSETIDGETIIIDFVSGAYFSTAGIGSCLWENLKEGAGAEEISTELRRRYPEEKQCLEQFNSFLELLLRENLIKIIDQTEKTELNPELSWPENYSPPELNKFTDMQDLLLLDPIHDTDEQGWPIRRDN